MLRKGQAVMQHKTEEATSIWMPMVWGAKNTITNETKHLKNPLRLLKEGKQVSQKAFPVLLKKVFYIAGIN